MAAYHHIMVHFPIALWTTAVLVVLARTFSAAPVAQAAAKVLTPLLALGVLGGIIAYATGIVVLTPAALTTSPMGRNHVMAATWTLAYWTLMLVTSWRLKDAVWEGVPRWIMLALAALGGVLLAVTGTVGGHLSGSPSAVAQLFRVLGWEVYTTFYVPNFMLLLIVLAAFALIAIGVAGRRRR